MRRYFLILVLLILPFQFSWAVAARYCQHEVASEAWHFGHHEHQHQSASRGDTPEPDKKVSVDTDCGVCHIVSLPLAHGPSANVTSKPRTQSATPALSAIFTSQSPRAPDRPQWTRLA